MSFAELLIGGGSATMQGPESAEVTASTGELVFRLPDAALLTGRVTGPDGTPIAGASVTNFGFGIGGTGVATQADGQYRLPVGQMGDAVGAMLIVTAPGFVQPTESMMVGGKPS